MGEARRREMADRVRWPHSESHHGRIDLHTLPPVPSIDGARLRELTGDASIPETVSVILRTFRAIAGDRAFHVGFCLGDGERFSAVGIAVIDRLMVEAPAAPLHVVPVVHEDIAWDIVLRHLRSFTGCVLLFCFPDSQVYDAGTAQIHYSRHVRCFDDAGMELQQLSQKDRQRIRMQKAEILGRPPPPAFYTATGVAREDAPWIFHLTTPAGKIVQTTVWDGRRSYAHEMPDDILRWVGGDRIAIVQVHSPVGIDRRSSLDLTHRLAKDFDGVIHWARDTETYQSILRSFVRLDLASVGLPQIPSNWSPQVTMFPASPG